MIGRLRTLLTVASVVAIGAHLALAQKTVTHETKDGTTYRVTRSIVQRPVVQTELQDRQQTVYREVLKVLTTETHDTYRTYQTPVIEYQWVTKMHGRWNPFVQPYFTQSYAPVTRWQSRTEVVSVPVTRRQWVPETRTVQVPVTTVRMVREEITSRVALNGPPVGGLAQFHNDPPRTNWQAADSTRR